MTKISIESTLKNITPEQYELKTYDEAFLARVYADPRVTQALTRGPATVEWSPDHTQFKRTVTMTPHPTGSFAQILGRLGGGLDYLEKVDTTFGNNPLRTWNTPSVVKPDQIYGSGTFEFLPVPGVPNSVHFKISGTVTADLPWYQSWLNSSVESAIVGMTQESYKAVILATQDIIDADLAAASAATGANVGNAA